MKYERYENELAHHGVKGMKWGVRKQRKAAKKAEKYLGKAHGKINRNKSFFYKSGQESAMNVMSSDDFINGFERKHGKLDTNKQAEIFTDVFSRATNTFMSGSMMATLQNDKNYIKAQKLIDEYDLVSCSEVVRANKELVDSLTETYSTGYNELKSYLR